MNEIKRFLVEQLKYEPYEVDLTIEDIEQVDQDSFSIIKDYVSGKDVSDYSFRDYSVQRFIKEKGFNVIASIIAVSKLKKDYDHYSELYSRPIK